MPPHSSVVQVESQPDLLSDNNKDNSTNKKNSYTGSSCSSSSSSSNAANTNLNNHGMPPSEPNNNAKPIKGILKNKSSKPKGMSISFSGKKHIKKIPHLNTMTEEDIEQIWYSHYDYDDIKASFEYTVFMMDAGEAKTVENDEHTTRGLEMRTEEGAWARFEHKRDAYNAVLDEQDRQWNDGEDDPEHIAAMCLEVTQSAAKGALERGLADKEAADELNKDFAKQLEKGELFGVVALGEDGVGALPEMSPTRRSQGSGKLRSSIMNKFGG